MRGFNLFSLNEFDIYNQSAQAVYSMILFMCVKFV